MLMLDQAMTPSKNTRSLTHFGAYHCPPDGHFYKEPATKLLAPNLQKPNLKCLHTLSSPENNIMLSEASISFCVNFFCKNEKNENQSRLIYQEGGVASTPIIPWQLALPNFTRIKSQNLSNQFPRGWKLTGIAKCLESSFAFGRYFRNRPYQRLDIDKIGLGFQHTGGFDDKKCVNVTRDNH